MANLKNKKARKPAKKSARNKRVPARKSLSNTPSAAIPPPPESPETHVATLPAQATQPASTTQPPSTLLELTLKDFVHEAWRLLEPVTPLTWNWHLDLICDYLTLIRDQQFKASCGQ